MRWHWQNLSNKEDRRGNVVKRRLPWNGRAWFNFGRDGSHYHDRRAFRIEWCVGRWWGFGAGVRLGPWGDEAVNTHVFVGYVALFVAFDSMALYKRYTEGQRDREYEFQALRDWDIRFKLGGSPLEWSRNQPWYWDWHCDLIDLVFGRTKHRAETLKEFAIVVPMPEGSYDASVKVERAEWRRPRWPFIWRRRVSAWVEIARPGGIPHPGKGENSWDCGMDGLCATGSSHTEPDAIIADVQRRVFESRERYAGSRDWVPSPAEA